MDSGHGRLPAVSEVTRPLSIASSTGILFECNPVAQACLDLEAGLVLIEGLQLDLSEVLARLLYSLHELVNCLIIAPFRSYLIDEIVGDRLLVDFYIERSPIVLRVETCCNASDPLDLEKLEVLELRFIQVDEGLDWVGLEELFDLRILDSIVCVPVQIALDLPELSIADIRFI